VKHTEEGNECSHSACDLHRHRLPMKTKTKNAERYQHPQPTPQEIPHRPAGMPPQNWYFRAAGCGFGVHITDSPASMIGTRPIVMRRLSLKKIQQMLTFQNAPRHHALRFTGYFRPLLLLAIGRWCLSFFRIRSSPFFTKKCPLLSTPVHSCPLQSHSKPRAR